MAVGGLGRRRRRMNKARVLIGPAAERDGGSPSRRLHHALTLFPFFFFNNILFKIYLYIYIVEEREERRGGGGKRGRIELNRKDDEALGKILKDEEERK